jgi:uncharacterized protein
LRLPHRGIACQTWRDLRKCFFIVEIMLMKKKSSTVQSSRSSAKPSSKSAPKTAAKTAAKSAVKKSLVKKPVKLPVKKAVKKTAKKAVKKSAKKALMFAVRKSVIHGRGVFAIRDIRKGKTLIEYTGERITWEEAERRYPIDPIPYHTFLFEIGDGSECLDGANHSTPAKWFNHSCKPNCEAEEDDDERVFVKARRDIKAGEELTYDYNLTCEEKMKKSERQRRYPCWCGVKKCRLTMLGQKD